jgi:hypothetical protein
MQQRRRECPSEESISRAGRARRPCIRCDAGISIAASAALLRAERRTLAPLQMRWPECRSAACLLRTTCEHAVRTSTRERYGRAKRARSDRWVGHLLLVLSRSLMTPGGDDCIWRLSESVGRCAEAGNAASGGAGGGPCPVREFDGRWAQLRTLGPTPGSSRPWPDTTGSTWRARSTLRRRLRRRGSDGHDPKG